MAHLLWSWGRDEDLADAADHRGPTSEDVGHMVERISTCAERARRWLAAKNKKSMGDTGTGSALP